MIKSIYLLLCGGIFFSIFLACSPKTENTNKMENTFAKGSFGYDREFLKQYYPQLITLKSTDGTAGILLSPELQGRVMTSTLAGEEGRSFGWLNYDLIKSGEMLKQFNPVGGEERFWLGPEGGQYSIYFKPNQSFDFENWQVPPSIDTEPFNVLEQHDHKVLFQRQIKLQNYADFWFELEVERQIQLLNSSEIENNLDIDMGSLAVVGYETQNKLTNIGKEDWQQESGLLSVWLLCMMTPSPEVTIVTPIESGPDSALGIKVNDNYFGAIDPDRLKSTENVVFFKADGKSRGKIGFSPQRATGYMGSYDGENNVLSILQMKSPNSQDQYVNSAWEIQEDPFSGDALNAYNDGPLEDGSQMGPFYEMESSSPALALTSGESYTHTQRMYHFSGTKAELNAIALKILKVSLEDISQAF